MTWIQLVIAVLSSSLLTAVVTGVFNVINFHQTDKQNSDRIKNEKEKESEELKRMSNKELAQNMYNIIYPAIHNPIIKNMLTNNKGFHTDSLSEFLTSLISDNSYPVDTMVKNWFNEGVKLFSYPNSKMSKEQFYTLIDTVIKGYYQDCATFIDIYGVIESHQIIKFNIDKLNTDIVFINEHLNMALPQYEKK